MKVRIREYEGEPIRESLVFQAGTLVPGRVLDVDEFQARRELSRGTVELAEGVEPVLAKMTAKKKVAAKKAAATPNADPDFLG